MNELCLYHCHVQDESVGEDACHISLEIEFHLQEPHKGGMREPTPTGGPLISTPMPWPLCPLHSHGYLSTDSKNVIISFLVQ